jgi:hypothetical protein
MNIKLPFFQRNMLELKRDIPQVQYSRVKGQWCKIY